MKYDSREDTVKHINRIYELGVRYTSILNRNILMHDFSKLDSPEKEIFDEFTPKLKDCTYGSDEYKGYLKSMGVALKHHYENNSHHPEHHNKVQDMPLWDITEMLLDWIGASERHDDGNIGRSIMFNKDRFNYSHELTWIMINTVMRMFKYTVWIGYGDVFAIYYGDTIEEFHESIRKDDVTKEFHEQLIEGWYTPFYQDGYGDGGYKYEDRYITVDNCLAICWKVNGK